MTGATDVITANRSLVKDPGIPLGPKDITLAVKIPTNLEFLSEYQAAFKHWPRQPLRSCLRPTVGKKLNGIAPPKFIQSTYRDDFGDYANAIKASTQKEAKKPPVSVQPIDVENSTTYRLEYHLKDARRPDPFNPKKKSYNLSIGPRSKFAGKSVYQISYPGYKVDEAKKCRPASSKPKDDTVRLPTPVPKVKESKESSKSPAPEPQEKSTSPEHVEETEGVPPKNPPPTPEEQKDGYCSCKKPTRNAILASAKFSDQIKEKDLPPFDPRTEAMDEYRRHPYAPRRKAFYPALNTNHITGQSPFDGQTTSSMAYKDWPVTVPKRPVWAKIPEYKPINPTEGMILDSIYMVDYVNPGVVCPVTAIVPRKGDDIIKHSQNGKIETTSYDVEFKEWTGSSPSEPYKKAHVYVPPRKKMDCLTIMKSHFTGEQTERPELCRHTSEHRKLNVDKSMRFSTTYTDTYTDRPKSCPSNNTHAVHSSAEQTDILKRNCPKCKRTVKNSDVAILKV